MDLWILKEAQFRWRRFVQCIDDTGVGATSFLLLWNAFPHAIAADIVGSFLHHGQPYVKRMDCYHASIHPTMLMDLVIFHSSFMVTNNPKFLHLKISFSLEILFPLKNLLLLSPY